jgi:hypothetical protein
MTAFDSLVILYHSEPSKPKKDSFLASIDVQVCFRNLRSLLECEIALFTVKSKKI